MLTKFSLKVSLLSLLFFGISTFVYAQEASVNVYFFNSQGCPHCHNEAQFLEKLEDKYPGLRVESFEVSRNYENRVLFIKTAEKLGQSANGVPFTVIGKQSFVGFSDSITGPILEAKINDCLAGGCEDFVGDIINPTDDSKSQDENIKVEDKKDIFSIPILGEISAKNISLPLLTLVLGFVDGFNPCAMWVLLFLISMLIGVENKKRRWILGMVFILTSAVVYFVFMSLWLNLLLFLGFIIWVRVIIGLVSLFGGLFSIKKGMEKFNGCSVTGADRKQKIFEKMKEVIHRKSLLLSLVGIITLAFSVNLIELICSAGLPAIYTQILAINNLSFLQYYSYILLYVMIFMLDDMVVFILAMKTLEVTGLTTKYSKATRLIGGAIMVIIGILLLFRPDWIMFG